MVIIVDKISFREMFMLGYVSYYMYWFSSIDLFMLLNLLIWLKDISLLRVFYYFSCTLYLEDELSAVSYISYTNCFELIMS